MPLMLHCHTGPKSLALSPPFSCRASLLPSSPPHTHTLCRPTTYLLLRLQLLRHLPQRQRKPGAGRHRQRQLLQGLADEMESGTVALVLVYENLWVHSVVGPWSEHGVRVVAEGAIHPDELVAALDAGGDD